MAGILHEIENVIEDAVEEVESLFTKKEDKMETVTTGDLIETMQDSHGHLFHSTNDARAVINDLISVIVDHLDEGMRVRLEN